MERKCKHGRYYYCKRLRMLGWLKERGFLPCETIPDVNNPKFNVFVFENTPELEDAIEEYFSK